MAAADKVELTRLAYDDGDRLRSTLLTSEKTPFATVKAGTGEQPGQDVTYVLLSEDLEPVYSFTIKMPENAYGDAVSSYLYLIDRADWAISYILVTQHLFNDDDLYEVVFETYDEDDESLYVYNETGEYLGKIPSHVLYEHAEKYYIYDRDYKNSLGDRVGALYEIKKGGSAVAQVKADAQTLSLAPNPVGYEETATLSLPSDMLQGGVVKVFDLNGKLLFNKECKAGDTEILIPAYRLNAGVNPVVVADEEGNILGSGKIIRK